MQEQSELKWMKETGEQPEIVEGRRRGEERDQERGKLGWGLLVER
jgi:hypothetical protein